jgi:TonB family protein
VCDLSSGAQTLAANSTPPRIDAQRPFKIDWEHYPEESKIKREEGWCVVSFTVGKDGHIEHASTRLERSSDSVLLDFACLQAFGDGQLVPATLHGRHISQRVGAVAVWAIEGPVPLRPKEHQVVSLCTKDSSVLPSSMVPPVNGQSFLTAAKLSSDKGWLLDPCFYRDDALKQFFGASKIDRFYTAQNPGRWEGINLAVPGSVFGHSGPGMLSVGLTVVFLPSGIQRADLRIDNTNRRLD